MSVFSGILYIACLCLADAAPESLLTDIFDDTEAKGDMEWDFSKPYIGE